MLCLSHADDQEITERKGEQKDHYKASAADDDGEKQRDEEAKIPLSTIIAQVVTTRDKSIFYHSLGCHVLR